MTKKKQEHRSLKDFSVQQRFGLRRTSTQVKWRDDNIAFFETSLKGSILGRPYLVFVHSPYPEPSQRLILDEEEIPYALSGRGVGKTALLEAFVEVAKANDKCEVLAFLNNREKLTDGDSFFEDFLVPEVLKRKRDWKDSLIFYNLESMLRRFGLFVNTSLLMFGALITWLITVLGLEIFKYFYDTDVRTGLENLIQFLSPYRGWIWIVGPVLLVCWWLYYLGSRDKDQKLDAAYSALRPETLMEKRRKEQRERLLSKPEKLLSLFSRRKCLALIIDDVDYLDSRSLDSILDLFQAVQDSNSKHRERMAQTGKFDRLLHQVQDSNPKHRACIALSFNPRNPILWFPERARIRDLLSEETVRAAKTWPSICITPLDLEELVGILCDYFDSFTPEKLIEIIGKEYPEALQRTGQLLGFFVWLEAVLGKQQRPLEEVEERELLNEFQRYVYRDEREIEQIVGAIQARDKTGGSQELLKFMLAFQKQPAQVDRLKKLLDKEGYENLSLYEKVLRDEPVKLLRRTTLGSLRYEFREAYLRYRFLTGWREWKDQSAYYYTKVFHLLCSVGTWDAEQALKSEPSKAAVEILYSEGLYFYQYHGHSDGGYALRFLGLDKGGALGKWLSLCKACVDEDKDLWDMLYWEVTTSLSPYRNYKPGKSLPAWFPAPDRVKTSQSPLARFFAPDLLITAGTAYWLIGQTQTALDLLTNRWRWVKSHLSPDYPDEWPEHWVSECKKKPREGQRGN